MRAIAALCVAVLHISQKLETTAGSGQWLLQFADFWQLGAFGVSLFFIVSGFVIPASLDHRQDRAEGIRKFAIRRFFRLYPAYWLSLPVALWAVWWLQGRAIDWTTVAVNITLFQRVLGFDNIVNFYWTLSYELIFYVVCAGLYALGVLHRPWALIATLYALVVAFAAAALLGLSNAEGYVGFYADLPSYLGLMFTGAVLRQWHDGEPLSRGVKVALAVIVLFFVVPAARSFKFEEGLLVFHPVGGWNGAFAILFFIIFAMRFRISHPLLSRLGAISYSLYLFHTMAAYFAHWLLAQPGLEWARGWDLTVYCAVILAMTIAFSAAVYRWLELPMIALGRRLSRSAVASVSGAEPLPHA